SGTPTSLSAIVIDSMLRNHLHFEGLVFTDALNMQGVSDLYPPGELELRALLAGNDVLLFAEDVPGAVIKIKAALQRGHITKAELESHVRRILLAKYGAGLNQYKAIDTRELIADLNDRDSKVLIQKIFNRATTVV